MKYLVYIEALLFIIALTLGFVFFMRKKSPLYFKLVFYAVICFLLEELYYLVDFMCTGVLIKTFSFASFAASAGYLFMFSANYGQFDSFVDDGSIECKKARKIAFLAPAILLLIYICSFLHLIKTQNDVLYLILIFITKLPSFFAIYYHFKHLILPDVVHFVVDSLRPFNAISIVLIFSDVLSDVLLINKNIIAYRIIQVLIALLFVLTMFLTKRGYKKWKI